MNHKPLAEIKEPYSACLLVQNIPIGLINEYGTIMMQMAKIKLLSSSNLRHLNGITQNITECKMMNLYIAIILLIINNFFPKH